MSRDHTVGNWGSDGPGWGVWQGSRRAPKKPENTQKHPDEGLSGRDHRHEGVCTGRLAPSFLGPIAKPMRKNFGELLGRWPDYDED